MKILTLLLFFHLGQPDQMPTEQEQQLMWDFALKLAGGSRDMARPNIQEKPLPSYAGFADIEAGIIYLSPGAFLVGTAGFLQMTIIHEMIHFILSYKGLSGDLHHCWMSKYLIETQIAEWVIKTFVPQTRANRDLLIIGAYKFDSLTAHRCVRNGNWENIQ